MTRGAGRDMVLWARRLLEGIPSEEFAEIHGDEAMAKAMSASGDLIGMLAPAANPYLPARTVQVLKPV